MIKRPLHKQFSGPVVRGEKFTTIREKPWPVGVPIMLYNWSGAAYRSPQVDVAAVIVTGFWTIQIAHRVESALSYGHGMENAMPLWQTEGFASRDEMDEWFRPLVKPGHTATKHLMRFRLLKEAPPGARPPTPAES